ncbi:TonB-dependent receptor domain-containing protein [Piscinibacter sp.]|uniref:TonB-dependent receptor domain-containing protein n=1 Tax=Piscinibacter sp. TaxID=1903157 RepID=UPI002F3F750D
MSRSSLVLRAIPAAARVCVFVAAVCPVLSSAQTASLAPVVVTGTREPTALDRIVADVVVIDAERIRSTSADSLEDLLRREGGIQLSRTGGPGQGASVLLRGAGANNTVVLIDGVRVGSATLGQTDLSGLGLAQIERIEILRGPGSSLYGSDAAGGVVQIFTRRGSGTPRVAAHAAIGGYGSSEADASVSGAAQSFDYAATLSREASDGVSAIKPGDSNSYFNADRDGFRRTSAQLRGGFTFAPGQRVGASVLDSRLRSQFDSADFDPVTFVADPSPDFRNRLDMRVASLDYRGTLSPEWTTSLQLAKQRDDLRSGGTTLSRYATDRRQITWQNAWTPKTGQQFVGALERLDESVTADALPSAPQRHNDALVFGYTGQFGAHKLQADVRHDRNSAYGGVSTGKLGWGFDALPGLSLRAVAGTAFRGPSFNELYFPGYGVPTIRPERARSIEVGAVWHAGTTTFSGTLYRNRLRDMIGYEPDPTKCLDPVVYMFGCAANVSRARLQGATLAASHQVGAFSLRGSVDFLDAKDVASGQRLVRRAAHQETVGVDWTQGALTLGATVLDVGSRPDFGAVLPGYQTLDLQARYRFSAQWQVEAKLLNATDRRYEPAHDYQALGRQAWIGIRYDGAGL